MCRVKVCLGLGNFSVCVVVGGEVGWVRVVLEVIEGVVLW